MKTFLFITFISISLNLYPSPTYSVAGITNIENMDFLVKQIGINTFEVDLPWKNYHKKHITKNNNNSYYFEIDENLDNILKNIRKINGKVLIQISTHYTPTWVLEDFPSILLRDYYGRSKVLQDELYHTLISPYAMNFQREFIVPWIEFVSQYLYKNYSDIITYINPSILEEGQLSYPWSGNEKDSLVFWSFDKYFLNSYENHLKKKFSNNLKDLNNYYSSNFSSWNNILPLKNYNERNLYSKEYYYDFINFYKKGLLDISKLYSGAITKYFPHDKLLIKIPLWHRGMANQRTHTESRFVDYYISNLNNYYKNILFLPIQDLDNLEVYISHALELDYNILLEATKKVGDYNNVELLLNYYDISGINFINIEDLVGESQMQDYYKSWIETLNKKYLNSTKKEK